MTDADAQNTAFNRLGYGAYDHVLRNAMMEKVAQCPTPQKSLVNPRTNVGRKNGVKHQIHQAEGGTTGSFHVASVLPCNPRCGTAVSLVKGTHFRLPGRCVRNNFSRGFGYNLQFACGTIVGSCRDSFGKTRVWTRTAEHPSTWTISELKCGTVTTLKSFAHPLQFV